MYCSDSIKKSRKAPPEQYRALSTLVGAMNVVEQLGAQSAFVDHMSAEDILRDLDASESDDSDSVQLCEDVVLDVDREVFLISHKHLNNFLHT